MQDFDLVYISTNIECYGNSSGEISLQITNGALPLSFDWSTGGTTQDLSGLAAGNYQVVIEDANECFDTSIFILSENPEIILGASVTSLSCSYLVDGSIQLNMSGAIASYTYDWSTGSALDSIGGLQAGTYSITVTDSLNCSVEDSFVVQSPDTLSISFANYTNSLSCYGELTIVDVVINGGIGPFSVLWNDGDTTIQKVLGAGSYSCDVTDMNGCNDIAVLTITEPDSLEVILIFTCDSAGSNASISVSGGVGPISIVWNTGDTTSSINSLGVDSLRQWGALWVIVSDSCGNSVSDTFEVFPYFLETSVSYNDSIHVGEVEIDNLSLIGPFSYLWVDVFGIIIDTTFSASLCQGTYFVTTTDNASNCSVTDTLEVMFYLPNGIIDLTTTTVFDNEDLWRDSDYTYLWGNGENTQHADICPDDPPNSFWVEVIDNIACTVRADFEIDPLLITLTPAEIIIECNLENLNVELGVIAEGGTPPYTYQWSSGSTDNPLNIALNPGNHNVTVIDYNACTEDTAFVIKSMTSECIPNVFTPDGNDINDTWSLEDAFLFTDSEIRVYGRYGKLLFQSADNHAWDGTNEKGDDVPDGVYFYSIDIGHGFDPINGTVTILRQR